MTTFQMLGSAWGVVTGLYFLLFLYHSLVGMKEEDHLYLSTGESRFEAEQKEVMKRISKLESVQHKVGWAALALTIVVAGMWGYDAFHQLF